jgi:signal transduction histidine kinase
MFHPSASLRTVVGTIVAIVAALSLVAATALVLITTELRRASEDLRAAVESVVLAEEAAIDLLLHARVEDLPARQDIERRLRERLERARELVGSSAEGEILRSAHDSVEAHLAAAGSPGTQDTLAPAFAAIEGLVAANVRQSREADARARRLDGAGNALGIGIAALLLVSTGWLLWWLRRRAFQPLAALADAMTRFGKGEGGARAPEEGPAELRAMARRFNEMAAALAALRERQMTFLAALAHELRNPLSALKLATSGPRSGDGGDDARLGLVRRQVLRLERMVGDFLDTARIEAGRLEVRREPVDLRPIVQNVVSLFSATSAAHRITARLPDGEVVAVCDPGRVEQVLNNLVGNAVKYSPEGGRISVVVEPRLDAVEVAVTDEGVGISAPEREAIFEPFRRGDRLRAEVPGVGLGLYVSRRIVEAHGGRIRVDSTPGGGSTFVFVLPR